MFTGIITDCGAVREFSGRDLAAGGIARLVIATGYDTAAIADGASVACNGCCLSVVAKGPDWLAFEVSRESLAVTALANWRIGEKVNLERALRAGDELGGHLVSGHVDGIGHVAEIRPDGEARILEIAAPARLMKFVAPKGSIAIDGVSLTVNRVAAERFSVTIIPLTLRLTNLGGLGAGDAVNLEIDPIARYVARLLESEAR